MSCPFYISGNVYQVIAQKATLNTSTNPISLNFNSFPFTIVITSQSGNIVALYLENNGNRINCIGIIECRTLTFASSAGDSNNYAIRGSMLFECSPNQGKVNILSQNGPYAISSCFYKIN